MQVSPLLSPAHFAIKQLIAAELQLASAIPNLVQAGKGMMQRGHKDVA